MIDIVLLTALLAAAAPPQRGLAPQNQSAVESPSVQNAEPGHRVTGRVYPDENGTVGSPVAGFPMAVLPARGNAAEIAGKTQSGSALTARTVLARDGSFEFEPIPPGTYRVTIVPSTSLAPLDIHVGDQDVDVQFGRPLIRVFGTVAVDDGGPPPPFELRFNAASDASDARQAALFNQVRVARGFTADLAPGSYRLAVAGLPAGFNVKSATMATTDVTSRDFKLAGPEPVEIGITLGVATPSPWVRVSGRVGGSPDIPAVTGVTLSGEHVAGTLEASVNRDGSFEFPKVLPGSYLARTLPAVVDFPRAVVIGPGGMATLELARPTAKDFAGAFVPIVPGEFMMGCAADDSRCLPDEKPARRVAITRRFEIGKYEVTQKQWEAVTGTNPSQSKGTDRPVDSISWHDAEEFIARLNSLGGEYRYRLPTEAEWEFAARAGSAVPDPDQAASTAFGWFSINADQQSHPVGEKLPNAWGLYDTRGNVAEWVEDWYDTAYYLAGPALDPSGPPAGAAHVLRGGSFQTAADRARVSTRQGPVSAPQNYGFRLVRERRP